jgi:hypothetical protein
MIARLLRIGPDRIFPSSPAIDTLLMGMRARPEPTKLPAVFVVDRNAKELLTPIQK